MIAPPVLHLLGRLLALTGLLPLLPAGLAALEGSESWPYLFTAGLMLFAGAGLAAATAGQPAPDRRGVWLFVALCWLVLPAAGALPFALDDTLADPVDALFEAVSGMTTTGATVYAGLDGLPRPLLLWRALLNWSGGLLAVVLVFVFLAPTGIGGLALARNAVPGGDERTLDGRFWQMLRALAWVYAGLTLLCAASLSALGWPAFDAVCVALSTLSTGGFLPRDGGIAAYGSPAGEVVLMLFMLAGSINLTLHWGLAQGRWRELLRDSELRYLAQAATAAIVLAFFWFWIVAEAPVLENLRQVAFTVVSMLTTTAFDPGAAGQAGPDFSPIVLIGLVLVGGCMGSTAGGLKLMRLSVLFKQSQRELTRLSFPHAITNIRSGTRPVADRVTRQIWAMFFTFVLALSLIAVVLALDGIPPVSAIAAGVAALTNAGPALAQIDPGGIGWGAFSGQAKAALMVAMVLGRLELLALLMLLNPGYWRG